MSKQTSKNTARQSNKPSAQQKPQSAPQKEKPAAPRFDLGFFCDKSTAVLIPQVLKAMKSADAYAKAIESKDRAVFWHYMSPLEVYLKVENAFQLNLIAEAEIAEAGGIIAVDKANELRKEALKRAQADLKKTTEEAAEAAQKDLAKFQAMCADIAAIASKIERLEKPITKQIEPRKESMSKILTRLSKLVDLRLLMKQAKKCKNEELVEFYKRAIELKVWLNTDSTCADTDRREAIAAVNEKSLAK